MSKALTKLDATVNKMVQNGTATKCMKREELIDFASRTATVIKSHLAFFSDLAAQADKMQQDVLSARKANTKNSFMNAWNEVYKGLTGVAKMRMEKNFCGAIVDTSAAMASLLDDVVANIDKLFADKSINLYNTKISHVAIYGMIDRAEEVACFDEMLIAAYLESKNSTEFKLTKGQSACLAEGSSKMAEICNMMINGKTGKTFAAAIQRYKSSGNDVNVVTADNQAAGQFAKLDTTVNEGDVEAGCKGLWIFKWIGDKIVDMLDNRARKQRILREQHKARVEFLQMELEGVDPNSEKYKKLVKAIKFYQDEINRLNQKLDEYYNED